MLRETYRLSGLGLRTPNVYCGDVSVGCFRDLSRVFTKISRATFVQVVTKGVICGTVKSSGVQRSRNDGRLKGNKFAGIHVGIPVLTLPRGTEVKVNVPKAIAYTVPSRRLARYSVTEL